jgi:hypothetical protein
MHITVIYVKSVMENSLTTNVSWASWSALLVIQKSMYGKIKDRKCALCDYTTLGNVVLAIHLKLVHGPIRDNKCTQCHYIAFFSSL